MSQRFTRLSPGAKLAAIAVLLGLAVLGYWLGYWAGHFLGTH